jgi:hypothetical protein
MRSEVLSSWLVEVTHVCLLLSAVNLVSSLVKVYVRTVADLGLTFARTAD